MTGKAKKVEAGAAGCWKSLNQEMKVERGMKV